MLRVQGIWSATKTIDKSLTGRTSIGVSQLGEKRKCLMTSRKADKLQRRPVRKYSVNETKVLLSIYCEVSIRHISFIGLLCVLCVERKDMSRKA